MDNKVNLVNNYFLIKDSFNTDITYKCVDIKDLSYQRLNNPILLKIDFNNINKSEYKYILKKLFKIKKKDDSKLGIKQNSDTEILLGFLDNYNENNDEQRDFINGLKAIFCNDWYDMYNYIYDTVCNFLDEQFYKKNLCDFKENKCTEKRCTNSSSLTGCCNHYKHKFMSVLIPKNSLVPCEYLKNKQCDAKCISCKLFTCDTLRKKGIIFKIKDILLLDTFFNPYQKYIIKTSTFTPKKKIIKKLLMAK